MTHMEIPMMVALTVSNGKTGMLSAQRKIAKQLCLSIRMATVQFTNTRRCLYFLPAPS